MNTNPNDSAFAYVKYDESGNPFVDSNMTGLTKREYFAAMILQGLCSGLHSTQSPITEYGLQQSAVSLADALIEALNQKPQPK